jgi:hypothetical protein
MEPKEELATKKDLERVERTFSEQIDRVEQTLTVKIEANSSEIKKVERPLSRKIDRVEKTLDAKIDKVEKRLDEKIDRVILQVIKNSEAINKMVTRDEFNEFRNEVLSGQDKMMTILIRLDQERIFTNEWIRRIEAQGEQNKRDIERLKVG